MNRSEPGWGRVDTEVGESFGRTPIDQSFEVALGSRFRKVWGQLQARSFQSKGTLRVSGSRVTIRTSASRLIGADVDTDLELRCDDIYNVRVNGKLVQFDVVSGPGELAPIIVRARNKGEAALIAAALPTQMTPRYARENHERARFLQQVMTRTPHLWATWAIVAMTSLVFFVMVARGAGFGTVKSASAIAYGSNYGPYTVSGQWWRLLTSVFIHFGFVHFVFNMIVLVQTGRIVERLFGNVRFLVIYLFAGLTGSLMSLLWHPGINSAGASGAIFGVLGSLLAYVLRYSDSIPRSIFLKHFRMAALFIGYNLYWGFTHRGIDNGAHVGGLIGGFMLACVLAPPIDDSDSSRERSAFVFGASGAVACTVLGGLMWALLTLSARPDRQEAMQFSEVLQQLGPVESKAIADVKSLAREPVTGEGRAEYAGRIRTTVIPEWNQLYAAIDKVQVPAGSSDAALKDGLLRYYGDVTKAMQLLADMADSNQLRDYGAKSQIKELMDDAKRQAAMIRRGAAPL
ncbi:rhomboid family intramembrane serine protease [Paraburkholderia humisilvae]|uniref:Rhomboid protease GlpG n=1 Tax=Paraburkholderia humisilvae TaxID=627669 RepID=A0A6J5DR67_9BURK|nr:rhomboid family intramembrane serine protease [Paraburkholderia humisilvae]CAB3756498.1 Rhomboid protease GlpG [Paraburkholderia humisilvae]